MLVGGQAAFLSHLPMFERLNQAGTEYLTPHRFQVIVRASFNQGGQDVGALYFAERTAHPEVKMFTVSPVPFVLPRLAAPAPLTSFRATVFRGHLERGGQRIRGLDGITVNVKQVVHFHKFDPAASAPARLEYLLFGRGQELFLAHSILKPPDFDQIVSVAVTGIDLTDDLLSPAMRIVVPERKNSPPERVKERQPATAETAGGATFSIRGLKEYYFEEGELRMPPTFDPTPEEAKSDFSE